MFEYQIWILKCLLKDYVTLKTEVMAPESSSQIKLKNIWRYYKNILQYYCFYCIFYKITAAFVSVRDSLKEAYFFFIDSKH